MIPDSPQNSPNPRSGPIQIGHMPARTLADRARPRASIRIGFAFEKGCKPAVFRVILGTQPYGYIHSLRTAVSHEVVFQAAHRGVGTGVFYGAGYRGDFRHFDLLDYQTAANQFRN